MNKAEDRRQCGIHIAGANCRVWMQFPHPDDFWFEVCALHEELRRLRVVNEMTTVEVKSTAEADCTATSLGR